MSGGIFSDCFVILRVGGEDYEQISVFICPFSLKEGHIRDERENRRAEEKKGGGISVNAKFTLPDFFRLLSLDTILKMGG